MAALYAGVAALYAAAGDGPVPHPTHPCRTPTLPQFTFRTAHVRALRAHVEALHGMHFNDVCHGLVRRANLEGFHFMQYNILVRHGTGMPPGQVHRRGGRPVPLNMLFPCKCASAAPPPALLARSAVPCVCVRAHTHTHHASRPPSSASSCATSTRFTSTR
jgi:hypothetical protein